MKTQEQLKNLTSAPENKTVKLSLAAARVIEGAKEKVNDIINIDIIPINTFGENEDKTLILGELLGVDKSKLGNLTLTETLTELDVRNFQLNNNSYKGKTVKLAGLKSA